MHILDKIIAQQRADIDKLKLNKPLKYWEAMPLMERECTSMKKYLLDPSKNGIIAEFKRRSPSKGLINGHSAVEAVIKGYEYASCSGMSVLTNEPFFGGSSEDLQTARKNTNNPLLRKDFIIDEYQLVQAKAIGADIILLIAECLEPAAVKRLSKFAKTLGLEVLLEMHSAEMIDRYCAYIDVVGINNRDLKTFVVDFQKSIELLHILPNDCVKIAESGISDVDNIIYLKKAGFQGFLIGEHFMKTNDPAKSCLQFTESLTEKWSIAYDS